MRRPLLTIVVLVLLAAGGLLLALLALEPGRPAGVAEPEASAPAADEPAPGSVRLDFPRPAGRGSAQLPAAPEGSGPQARAALAVRLVDGSGEPHGGAEVVLVDEDWRQPSFDVEEEPNSLSSWTGADGRAVFSPAPEGYETLLALVPDHLPRRADLDAGASEQVVVVDEAVSLSGAVLVDRLPPPGPVDLVVSGFRDASSGWSWPARRELEVRGAGNSRARVRTSASGAFVLRGIPAGELVTVCAAGQLRLQVPPDGSDPRCLEVRTPGTLLLELVRPNTLAGRPVAPPGAGPTPGRVTVRCTFRRAGGATRTDQQPVRVGERFALPFHELDLASAELTVVQAGDAGELLLARRVVDGPLSASLDLGDLVLDGLGRELELRVVDRAGEPVAGALALADKRLSPPTDAEGLTRVQLGPLTEEIAVGALGYELRRVAPPPAPARQLAVELVPSNRLRIEVVGPAPGNLQGAGPLRAAVHLPGTLEDDAPEANGRFASVRGPAPGGGMWTDADRTEYYEIPSAGVLELCDLPPEVDIDVELQDRYQNGLATRRLVLARGEQRTLRFDLPGEPRTVAGRVVDPAGAPIAQARLSFGGFLAPEVSTDAEGAFELAGVYGEDPTLFVDAAGCVGRELRGAEVFTTRVVVLEPARSLWVEVVDDAGRRVRATVRVRCDGRVLGGAERSVGLYQVEGVPLTTVTCSAQSADLEGSTEAAAGAGEVRIVLAAREGA